ncbi:MAG TPA: helix-turn-helix domain-containing protein [Jiangellaceae bacterium]
MERSAEWVVRQPSPRLAPFVDRYIGYRLAECEPGLHRGLPSAHMTLIASIGPGIDVVAQADPAQSPDSYDCVVGGLSSRAALISNGRHQEGVAVELTPVGSRALLGMPAGELQNISLELSDVTGSAGAELWLRLQSAAGWPDRFAVCDEVLGQMVDPDDVVSPELTHAWRALLRTGGTAPVTAIAESIGWSRQHLARRFGSEFGLGPKVAARVIRFSKARRMLVSTPSFVTLAQVAAACGYYDQAHLDRDFAELAGCSPSAWMATEQVPFVQDAEPTIA